MSFLNQYKKDVESVTTTNIAYDGIKERIVMKNQSKKQKAIALSSILGGAALLAASVALVITLTHRGNTPAPVVPSDRKMSIRALANTATPLVSASFANEAPKRQLPRMLRSAYIDNTKTDDEIIQDLLYQFDTIIENDNSYTVYSVESDKTDYDYREDVTFTNLLGEETSYSLYYNDVTVREEIDSDEDEVEIEKETQYSGLAVQGDNNCTFRLELSEENNGVEQEIESVFYLYSSEDLKSYTKVTSSSEIEGLENETEYSFEVIENGVVTTSYEIEIEYGPNNNEVEISIKLNEKEYSITRVIQDDETYFYVELENELTDTETEYVFKKIINDDTVTYELISQSDEQ